LYLPSVLRVARVPRPELGFLANGAVTTYAYTPERGFLSRLTVAPLTGQNLDILYSRDLTGRMTSQDSSVNTEEWLYSYDVLGQLTLADNQADNAQERYYNYDLAGNMIFNHNLGCRAWPQNFTYPTQGAGAHYGDSAFNSLSSLPAKHRERPGPTPTWAWTFRSRHALMADLHPYLGAAGADHRAVDIGDLHFVEHRCGQLGHALGGGGGGHDRERQSDERECLKGLHGSLLCWLPRRGLDAREVSRLALNSL
jgi:hypothetical protein